MLICDRCQAPISDGSRFCPTCGDPVTAADRIGSRLTRTTERVQLVCPACERPSLFDIPAHGAAQETCPRCDRVFGTRVVRVKAKRSAGNRKLDTRSFSVRVEELNGREDLIEFDRPSYEDFELRARDLAAFTSRNGRLALVQNLTVGRSMRLASGSGCGGVAVLAGLLVVLLGFCGVVLGDGPSPGAGPASVPSSESPSAPPAAAAPEAGQAEPLYVHDVLNVRAEPDPNAARVRALSRGDLVRLGPADADGWSPVYDVAGRREGYVYRASGRVQRTAPVEAPPRSATAPSSSGGRRYYIGPRGGCYTYSASGNKRYVDRSYCY